MTPPAAMATAVELATCVACGEVCEVSGDFAMPGVDGPERYVRTRCLLGHVMVGPAFALHPRAG